MTENRLEEEQISGVIGQEASDVVEPGKPLVVGAPRSGFSLLISIIHNLLNKKGEAAPPSPEGTVLRRLVQLASFYTTQKYRATFARFGVTRDLIFNGEFHVLQGGPKWLRQDNPQFACIRKYFGVRGQGDFLLVTSHPRKVLEYDAVVHSHTAPQLWLREDYYKAFRKLTSVRNPIGIINSASFSLNAMASQYIQTFMPGEIEEYIRQRHGLYKLTDLEFFSGLIRFLKGYLDEHLVCQDQYFVMRWEDLIASPAKTICRIAAALQLDCSQAEAEAIWRPMDHVNLLQYHKHNFRKGKGIVGDWKNSLVNEHMEIFRQHGFDNYLERLGYPPVPTLNLRSYTPYQRLVAAHLKRGEVYRDVGDQNLFGFAFNKSNIDASKFGFKAYPQRTWTRVERSTVADETLVGAVSDTAEECCGKINAIFETTFRSPIDSPSAAAAALTHLEREWGSLMRELQDPRGVTLCVGAGPIRSASA